MFIYRTYTEYIVVVELSGIEFLKLITFSGFIVVKMANDSILMCNKYVILIIFQISQKIIMDR